MRQLSAFQIARSWWVLTPPSRKMKWTWEDQNVSLGVIDGVRVRASVGDDERRRVA